MAADAGDAHQKQDEPKDGKDRAYYDADLSSVALTSSAGLVGVFARKDRVPRVIGGWLRSGVGASSVRGVRLPALLFVFPVLFYRVVGIEVDLSNGHSHLDLLTLETVVKSEPEHFIGGSCEVHDLLSDNESADLKVLSSLRVVGRDADPAAEYPRIGHVREIVGAEQRIDHKELGGRDSVIRHELELELVV